MCFSLTTSAISYMLGLASAIFALCTRQWVLGLLILSYCQMQLSEMMIWYSIDEDNKNWNKIGTSFGKYLLATHVTAIGLGLILSVIFVQKRSLKIADFIPFGVGALFFIIIVAFVYAPGNYPDMTYPLKRDCAKTCQNSQNRLQWPYPHNWYIYSFLLSMIFVIAYVKPIKSKILFFLVFSITFLLTSIFYSRSTVGSVWCWSAAFLAPVIVGLNYYLIRNEPNSAILT